MTVLDDIRFSARLLVRAPAFAVAAVLTLGLGIGAGTAVFSAIDTILRPPSHLAGLIRISPLEDGRGRHVRLDDLETWRAAVPEHAFTAFSVGAVNVGVSGAQARRVERVAAAAVDHQYFEVLRAETIQGRTFGERTEPNVAVISEAFWSRRLLARPDVVGTSLTVDGAPHTIIGILPDEHRFPNRRTCPVAAGRARRRPRHARAPRR